MSSSAKQRPSSVESRVPEAAPAVRKYVRPDFRFVFPFDLPSTPEAVAVRIVKNLAHFGLFYALVLWVGLWLSISLVLGRWTSFFILLLMTLVLFALGVVTWVALILTDAAIHMLLTFAIGIPLVLVHAVFWRDDLRYESTNSYGEEASVGEVDVPLVKPDHDDV